MKSQSAASSVPAPDAFKVVIGGSWVRHETPSEQDALEEFHNYMMLSKNGCGQYHNKDVTLMKGGEVIKKHVGGSSELVPLSPASPDLENLSGSHADDVAGQLHVASLQSAPAEDLLKEGDRVEDTSGNRMAATVDEVRHPYYVVKYDNGQFDEVHRDTLRLVPASPSWLPAPAEAVACTTFAPMLSELKGQTNRCQLCSKLESEHVPASFSWLTPPVGVTGTKLA